MQCVLSAKWVGHVGHTAPCVKAHMMMDVTVCAQCIHQVVCIQHCMLSTQALETWLMHMALDTFTFHLYCHQSLRCQIVV